MPRLTRRLWPDRNPLRRTVDRVEAAIVAGLLAVFLAGVPLAAWVAARHTAVASARAERAGANLRQVPAVLLRQAPPSTQPLARESMMSLVPARWTAPDGTPRAGEVYAPGGAAAGTTVMVWTDQAGTLEGAPPQPLAAAVKEALAALTAAVLVGLVVAAGGYLARRALDRRRLDAWDVEWARTGPQWTGQH